ncbi:transcriptional regulator [Youhaiella tibetensis]|uniref:Helix-turn-helix domain-containing protein n=1 Tax=Paradevosia tibetensis TaxID=1447062 RepID=A0A5B9DPV5_9HYPH|nr:XRE family transcriptional regulator [Youhaiella tibetensis]QEE20975.1 helix-turn-helix domain-containing protein [Youhaiella tibetensis]GGF19354.1 transcriptional regulator [Youhaiella tibetensis]
MSDEFASQVESETYPMGHRLRERRIAIGLTLKQVADGAGLSVGFISQIERGITMPSLSSLVSICKVLKTDVGTYLQQPRNTNRLSRHGERQVYSLVGAPSRNGAQPITYERVSSNFPGRHMHSVLMNIPAGYKSEVIAHDGEEMLYVLSGEVTSIVNDNHAILQAGDAEHFPSTHPHSVWNHTQSMAIALWVGTQELFGEESPDE